MEMANILQGLGVTRLIHNEDRSEDDTIEKLLKDALEIRTRLKDYIGSAETLNSLGSLMQKKDRYDDAHGYYMKSLTLRERHAKKGDTREVLLAQSYVSLGNLLAQQADFVGALDHLHRALDCYVEGFSPQHPKVAWAHEGIARVLMQQGNLGAAQAELVKAIEIRSLQQGAADGKELFGKELTQLHIMHDKINARHAAQKRLRSTIDHIVNARRIVGADN